MGLLFWNKTSKRVDAFAVELATGFFSNVSPDALTQYFGDGHRDKNTRKGVESHIRDLTLRLNQFKELYKLGIYGKAKFHQVFMARLDELGYDSAAIKELNNLLMVKTP